MRRTVANGPHRRTFLAYFDDFPAEQPLNRMVVEYEPCNSALRVGTAGSRLDAASRFSGMAYPLASAPTSDLRNPAAGEWESRSRKTGKNVLESGKKQVA
jgi:hypothetical protein